MIKRELAQHLQNLAQQFPVVAIMGPRQSGKTTLVKETFPNYAYVTLEDLDTRSAALSDPRSFFDTYSDYDGVIFDEIQKAPDLFSYMQGIVDQEYRPGYFILTGSQNFLLYEKITQTLAGRIALLTLLPLSISELQNANLITQNDLAATTIKGFYPRLYDQTIDLQTWCSNYISTYVEKDVRQVLKISDIISFQGFLKLCAARIGNLLNYSDIARDADISANTAKAWISILEASYIIKLLPPYYKNFNKRVIKSPKIYFYDTALVCSLLGIKTKEQLHTHPLKEALFESMVISELFKYHYNRNQAPNIYFWRDVQKHEIDAIIEKDFDNTIPVEIKATMTYKTSFFKGLLDWKKISKQEDVSPYVIYGGSSNLKQKHGDIFSWHSTSTMLDKIYK